MTGSRRRLIGFTGALIAALLVLIPSPAKAADSDYAPLDHPGPTLGTPEKSLAKALRCRGDFSSPKTPVLFVPGTGTTPDQAFEWNYGSYFRQEKRPYCTITMPEAARGDLQVNGEYVVYAIRRTYAKAGDRPIAVLGVSQGGMLPRWALRFWPDTRPMVAKQIGMAGDNHGTSKTQCSVSSPCTPAHWQQDPDSEFLQALNSRTETFEGIDYTSIYSYDDKTVPASSARLRGPGAITNVAIQDICPTASHDHLTVGTIDPVTHVLVMDALNHDGPADPRRVRRSVCQRLLMPGITLTDPEIVKVLGLIETAFNSVAPRIPGNPFRAPQATSEPAVRCFVYADGTCPTR